MADSSGDKKHSASERRRRQAREEGQVVRSQDLTSAGMLLAAVATLWMFGASAAEQLAAALIDSLSTPRIESLETNDAANWLLAYASRLAFAAVPLLLAMLVAGVLVNLIQTGMVFSTKKVVPKLSHISPLSGVKRIASLQGVMRLGFGLFKVAAIAVVAFFAVQHYSASFLGCQKRRFHKSPRHCLIVCWEPVFGLVWLCSFLRFSNTHFRNGNMSRI